MSRGVRLLLLLASLAYPLLWYYGREQGWFFLLAALMAALWGIRAFTSPDSGQRLVSALVAVFFVVVLLWRQQDSMYWYPVWVNALMLMLFGGSLYRGMPLVSGWRACKTPTCRPGPWPTPARLPASGAVSSSPTAAWPPPWRCWSGTAGGHSTPASSAMC